MFLVRCPKCGNSMKTDPRMKLLSDIGSKRKVCVYCGFSMSIKDHIIKKL